MLIILEAILVGLYTFANGLPSPVIKQTATNPTLGYQICVTNSQQWSDILVGLMIGFNCLIVFTIGVVAFMSRNVSSAYNESKYIGLVIYFYIVVTLLGIISYFTVTGATYIASIQFSIRSFTFCAATYFTWGLLFFVKHQKIRKLEYDRKRRHMGSFRQSLIEDVHQFTLGSRRGNHNETLGADYFQSRGSMTGDNHSSIPYTFIPSNTSMVNSASSRGNFRSDSSESTADTNYTKSTLLNGENQASRNSSMSDTFHRSV